MKVSLAWLRKYISIEESREELAEILTDLGLEVEGIEPFESIPGSLKGVVIGEVKDRVKHPNADRLSVCKVDIGSGEDVQIVCGAPNVDAGQKVLVATVGSTLYSTEGEPWKIKKGKIRGETSEGMICAEDELHLGRSHDGIMVLDTSQPPGSDATEIFDVTTDTIYDIGLTPNRSDATSHLGVAQDLAAYFRINKREDYDVKLPDVTSFKVDQTTYDMDVEVIRPDLCPRYSGVMISDVKIGSSPDWIQNQLRSIGVRPVNNIVDITNYVLHEMGQPLHAFDADKIAGRKIIVDTLEDGTTFKTLDDADRKLMSDDLMICDGNREGLCIAGVFGGIGSGVTEATTNIFLESAHFNAGSIRRTSTGHDLRTDAAKCFEKGSDPSITVMALKRAAILIKEYGGGVISSEIIDEYPDEVEKKVLQLRYDKVKTYVGVDLEKGIVHDILRALNMEIQPVDDDSVKVYVPTNKADVTRDVDVIEEILRIYGFNKVEVGNSVKSTLNYDNYPSKTDIIKRVKNYLSSYGYHEMMNMSIIESSWVDEAERGNLVHINNTSNVQLDVLRPNMLLSGLSAVRHNINRQQTDLKLYEYGRVYSQDGEDFSEQENMSIFLSGKMAPDHWIAGKARDTNFHALKSDVYSVLSLLNVKSVTAKETSSDDLEYGIDIYKGDNCLVTIGAVESSICKKMDVKQEVYYACFDVKTMVDATDHKTQTSDISPYPSVKRDLAVVIDESVSYEALSEIAKELKYGALSNVSLFDIYKNEKQLGMCKKSYALSFLFEDTRKTLKDKEVDKFMTKLIAQFESKLGATIRK